MRVVAAAAPLSSALRANMTVVGALPSPKVKPTTYEAALQTDAAPFDSLPGVGFNTDPASAAIVPMPGHITGSGSVLIVDPAQNNTFKAMNGAWKLGATVQATAGASGTPIRYSLRGLSTTAQDDLVQSLSLQAERTDAAPGRAVRQARIGLYQPWNGSMDEGWSRWVLERTASRRSRYTRKTSSRRSRRRSTC